MVQVKSLAPELSNAMGAAKQTNKQNKTKQKNLLPKSKGGRGLKKKCFHASSPSFSLSQYRDISTEGKEREGSKLLVSSGVGEAACFNNLLYKVFRDSD